LKSALYGRKCVGKLGEVVQPDLGFGELRRSGLAHLDQYGKAIAQMVMINTALGSCAISGLPEGAVIRIKSTIPIGERKYTKIVTS
jgi:hypothetical protein